MKTYFFIIFIFLSSLKLYSQEYENYPVVSSQNDKEFIITSVSINANETVIAISVNNINRKPLIISRNMTLTTNAGYQYKIRKFSIGNGWLVFDKKYHLSKKYKLYLYFDKIPETTSINLEEINIEGGKYWKGISLKRKTSHTTYSYSSSYTGSNSELFGTHQQIRDYLTSNLINLDPIEGEYDVEFFGEYITPFVHQYLNREHYKIWIIRKNGKFTIYSNNEGFRKSRYLKIEPVGETNVYTFYYDTTPTRIYLQDLNHFKASLHLNNSSANTFRGAASTAPSVNILPVYDCIKVYPTMSMYADVIRKHIEEETKPTTWTGTGFALTNNYIVTNYHVVEEAKSISIQGINGHFNNKYDATVVATDKVNDLAILKVNGANISIARIPYSVKTSTAEVGEEIFVLGYPLTSTMGDEIKLTTGVISSKSGFQGNVSLYQISAPIQPGNSGGPLFDSKGNVIGVVSAKHRGAENVGYAIKASYLRNLMESAITTNVLPQTNRISAQNLSGKVKAVKNFVFMITCSSSSTGGSSYSGSITSSSNMISYPSVRSSTAERAKIKSVTLGRDYTAVEIISNNQSGSSYYQWCNIDRNTYILVNGTRYTMTKAEGIKIAPDKTYFSYAGQDITFTLYFPPIPTSATSMDLIESADSKWKFYGIKIR